MLHSIDQVITKIKAMDDLARYKKHCLDQIQALAADIVNDKQNRTEKV